MRWRSCRSPAKGPPGASQGPARGPPGARQGVRPPEASQGLVAGARGCASTWNLSHLSAGAGAFVENFAQQEIPAAPDADAEEPDWGGSEEEEAPGGLTPAPHSPARRWRSRSRAASSSQPTTGGAYVSAAGGAYVSAPPEPRVRPSALGGVTPVCATNVEILTAGWNNLAKTNFGRRYPGLFDYSCRPGSDVFRNHMSQVVIVNVGA